MGVNQVQQSQTGLLAVKFRLFTIALMPLALWAANTETTLLNRLEKATGKERFQILSELAEFYNGQDDIPQACATYRKAIAAARQINEPQSLGDATFAYGRYLYYKGFPDSAIVYLNQSLKIRESLQDSSGIGKCFSHLGLCYWLLKKDPQGLKYLQKALDIQRSLGDLEQQGRILVNIGNIYRDWSDYQAALKYYLEAFNIYQQINDIEGIAWLNFSIGCLYRNLGDYQNALEYLHKSLKVYRKIAGDVENTGGIRICYSILGDVYRLSGDNQKALEYLQKALELQQKSGVQVAVANGLLRLAQVYYALGSYDQALQHANRAYDLQIKQKDRSGLTEVLLTLGNIYNRLGQPTKALNFLQNGLKEARSSGLKLREAELLSEIASIYKAAGRPDSAYFYLSQTMNVRAEIFKDEISSRIAALQAQYEIREQEERNAQLREDIRTNELEIKRQKSIRNYMLLSAILALTTTIILIRLYTIKLRDNRLIAEARDKLTREIEERKIIEQEKESLIEQQKEALAKIKTLSGLIPICSHCKKIRNDKGYYEELEKYISEHSDAIFSHGICPDCLEKYYPGYISKIKKRRGEMPEQGGE